MLKNYGTLGNLFHSGLLEREQAMPGCKDYLVLRLFHKSFLCCPARSSCSSQGEGLAGAFTWVGAAVVPLFSSQVLIQGLNGLVLLPQLCAALIIIASSLCLWRAVIGVPGIPKLHK